MISFSSPFQHIDTSDHLYKAIQQLPKCELHAHLTGSVGIDCLKKIAETQGKGDIFNAFLLEKEKIAQRVPYAECFKFFKPVEQILGVDKICETADELQCVQKNIMACVYSVCSQYAKDNVTKIELRTSLKRIKAGEHFRPYLDAVLEGIKKAEQKTGVKVHLLLSIRRCTSKEDCEETVNLAIEHMYPSEKEPGNDYSRKKVVGMDLSGSSTEGNGDAAIEALKRAKEAGLPITAHIGESPQETSDQQRREIEEIKPERVGHAVNIHNRQILGDTPLEFCPSSAYYTQMHQQETDNPSYEEIRNKTREIFICCDDLTMFPVTLTEEVYRVAKFLGLDEEQIASRLVLAHSHRFKHYITGKKNLNVRLS